MRRAWVHVENKGKQTSAIIFAHAYRKYVNENIVTIIREEAVVVGNLCNYM